MPQVNYGCFWEECEESGMPSEVMKGEKREWLRKRRKRSESELAGLLD